MKARTGALIFGAFAAAWFGSPLVWGTYLALNPMSAVNPAHMSNLYKELGRSGQVNVRIYIPAENRFTDGMTRQRAEAEKSLYKDAVIIAPDKYGVYEMPPRQVAFVVNGPPTALALGESPTSRIVADRWLK